MKSVNLQARIDTLDDLFDSTWCERKYLVGALTGQYSCAAEWSLTDLIIYMAMFAAVPRDDHVRLVVKHSVVDNCERTYLIFLNHGDCRCAPGQELSDSGKTAKLLGPENNEE